MEKNNEKPAETTLYRKHRPQVIADVSGQDHILTIIKNALKENRIAHAYLFAGPRGTGKTTIARIIAKRLNCLDPKEAEPCGACAQCVAFQNKASLDLIEIDAASNRGIDEIRALKDRIGLAPASGKYKVYIIDEVHMLTKEAFNALLKTLEEPPSHAIFILATTELHKVPETIKSRCQTFLFRRATVSQLIARLKKISSAEGVEIEDNALSLVANHSEGCYRDAESLLGQVFSIQSKKITVNDVENMLGVIGFAEIQIFAEALLIKDAKAAIGHIGKTIERGASLRRFADDLTRYLRAAATFCVAQTHGESFDPVVEEKMQAQTKKHSADTFSRLTRLFLRAKSEMRDSIYEELPLELAVIDWCGENFSTPNNKDAKQAQNVVTSVNTEKEEIAQVTQPMEIKKPDPINILKNKNTLKTEVNQAAENPLLLEKITVVWRTFLENAGKQNPLLVSTLEDCKPSIVRGSTLYLVTQFNMFKERLADHKIREPLEDLLMQLVGEKTLIRIAHTSEVGALGIPLPTAEKQNTTSSESVASSVSALSPTEEALSVLGGELVAG